MNDALYIAATGMQGQQLAVDTIANNLANVTTPGFKRARVNFQDMVTRLVAGTTDPAEGPTMERSSGSGVGVSGVVRMFTPGEIRQTNSALDVAIRGEGFFAVMLPDGGQAYTRAGSFQVNKDGVLATVGGNVVQPAIAVGEDAREVTIQADGRVLGLTGADTTPRELGRIELAVFSNPSGLVAEGDGSYRASDASGEAVQGRPGIDSFGTLSQGHLEYSNVNLVDEMVSLMMAQRAYGLNVKLMQTADEMLALSNNLRR